MLVADIAAVQVTRLLAGHLDDAVIGLVCDQDVGVRKKAEQVPGLLPPARASR